MGGVFGILDSQRRTDTTTLMAKMADRMSHLEWYRADNFVESCQGIGLGHIGIGVFNPQPQPIYNEDRSLLIFMEGELYDYQALKQTLEAKGHRFTIGNDPEFALHLYEERGEEFVNEIDGTFVLIVFDFIRRIALIANDRFGLRPLYYVHHDGRLIFAPEIKGILQDGDLPKRLNLTAVAEYCRFQQVLGDKTFLEGITLFPNGSILLYDLNNDRLIIRSYWHLGKIPDRTGEVTFGEAVEETRHLLRQAVEKRTCGQHRLGVYLSGGMDSRVILAMMTRLKRPVVTFTYGLPGTRDMVYAQRIARLAGSQHHSYQFQGGSWVKDCFDLHLELTEGFHTWIHSHGMASLKTARQLMDVNLTGFHGEGTAVAWNDPLLMEANDDLAFTCRLYDKFLHDNTWPCLEECEERVLYTQAFYARVKGLAFESFAAELQKFQKYEYARRAEFFVWYNSDRRLYQNLTIYTASHLGMRYPFCDQKYVEFRYSLPPEFRYDRRLRRAVLTQESPRLSLVPYARDGLLPTTFRPIRLAHALIYRLQNRFNKHIYPLFAQRAKEFDDWDHWLRTDLRDWAECILFDKRTLERGIFDPRFLRSLWERHQLGKELWTVGKLATVMTLEMMLRKVFD